MQNSTGTKGTYSPRWRVGLPLFNLTLRSPSLSSPPSRSAILNHCVASVCALKRLASRTQLRPQLRLGAPLGEILILLFLSEANSDHSVQSATGQFQRDFSMILEAGIIINLCFWQDRITILSVSIFFRCPPTPHPLSPALSASVMVFGPSTFRSVCVLGWPSRPSFLQPSLQFYLFSKGLTLTLRVDTYV